MTIETARSMYCLWTVHSYFQENSRKHVVIVMDDKSLATIDGKETVA